MHACRPIWQVAGRAWQAEVDQPLHFLLPRTLKQTPPSSATDNVVQTKESNSSIVSAAAPSFVPVGMCPSPCVDRLETSWTDRPFQTLPSSDAGIILSELQVHLIPALTDLVYMSKRAEGGLDILLPLEDLKREARGGMPGDVAMH